MAFVSDLQIPNCIVQAGLAMNVIIILDHHRNYWHLVQRNAYRDLYFLGGVDPKTNLQRASDENVKQKNHFFIDLDLRTQNPEITDTEIKEVGHSLEGVLAKHSYLNNWRYICFSGNGIHIHYFGDPVPLTSYEHWREGMKHLISSFEKHTGMEADKGCINAARLCRLPGSWNNKNGKHTHVEILLHRPDKKVDLSLIEQSGAKLAQHAKNTGEADTEKKWEKGLEGVGQGERNETAASIAGRLLHRLDKGLWEVSGWGGLKEWNARNTPPLPEKELRDIFESIAKSEEKNRAKVNEEEAEDDSKRRSQGDRLVDYVRETETEFFHDEFGEPFACLPIKGHREICRIRSKHFKRWMCNLFLVKENKTLNPTGISSALSALEGIASQDGEQFTLHNRIAKHDGALWYDLSNEKWEAVRIDDKGWDMVSAPPILFHRFSHQAAQVYPVKGGDVRDLLKFTRLVKKEQEVLLLVATIASFIPDFPHPVFILYGDQGAAKTTLSKMLRRIIDPSQIKSLSLPNSNQDLSQLLSHHHCAFFDNLSGLPEWASDALCRAVTGDGTSKRELYTDDEDVIYNFQRVIALNGINIAASRPDLLDRSILFKLERIPKQERKAEQAFWEEFDQALPNILGGIMKALSKAMDLRPGIQLREVPRMADFTLWGCAIADAIGYTQQEFLDAYNANINEQHEEAIHENPVATVITLLMDESPEWQGSATQLLERIERIATEQKISINAKAWPKAPQALTRRLNEAKTNLAEVGIQIETAKGSGGRRTIRIEKAGRNVPITDALIEDVFGSGSKSDHEPTLPREPPSIEAQTEAKKDDSGDSGGISSNLPF
jgi:hypothetical protein